MALKAELLREPSLTESALSKALPAAADFMGLNQKESAEILGLSATKTSLMWNKKYELDSTNKVEWQMAVLFFRLYRSLGSIVGSAEGARTWLRGFNSELGAAPFEKLTSLEGLVDVVKYLDGQVNSR